MLGHDLRKGRRYMNILRRLLGGQEKRPEQKAPPPLDYTISVRPLSPLATPTGSPAGIAAVMGSPAYIELLDYFKVYPSRSLLSDHSRAVLYSLVRLMQPKLVAEIGTLYAGTTEVFARALWQNGDGMVHSVDPYGGERCPAIIAQWPAELQRHAQYHAKSSMDFFSRMVLEGKVFDLILVDGNHDYEYALFDLQMAARQIRPGGIIVMDNFEQAGPCRAARVFLQENPAWAEIGDAIAAYDPVKPFERARASLPWTSFAVLQAPDHLSIGAEAFSRGQAWIDTPRLNGLALDVVVPCNGSLICQVMLRGFADGNRWVGEDQLEDRIRIDVAQGNTRIEHRFDRPMVVEAPTKYTDALFTLEMNLSWQAAAGSPPLALAALPAPLHD
jgi:predicted O-methyltransferase YrrM